MNIINTFSKDPDLKKKKKPSLQHVVSDKTYLLLNFSLIFFMNVL